MEWNGTPKRYITELSFITNYTTLLQVNVSLCSRDRIAGDITLNYVENSLKMKKYHQVQHSPVHLCAMQFTLQLYIETPQVY